MLEYLKTFCWGRGVRHGDTVILQVEESVLFHTFSATKMRGAAYQVILGQSTQCLLDSSFSHWHEAPQRTKVPVQANQGPHHLPFGV